MEHIARELRSLADDWSTRISAFSEQELTTKSDPLRWSKKEIVGHLIDSAQNNLRRFICSQYESVPPKIYYDQNFWVIVNDYHHIKKEDLIDLWRLINSQIANVLSNMPEENYSRECDTGKHSVQLHTLSFLAEDYIKHTKHHLNQLIPGWYDVTYS